MSSIFELDERIRRLRETLSHLRKAALSDAVEIKSAVTIRSDPRACEDWVKFVSELRDLLAEAEALAAQPPAIANPPSRPDMAGARFGATLH